MRMSEIRVGMRLRDPLQSYICTVTVTELTPRGFRYRLDRVVSFIPRWGMSIARDGHEHFGYNGEASFELAE